MKAFKVIYQILKAFEKAMDLDEFDVENVITPENLGISENRLKAILRILLKEGYLDGGIFVNCCGIQGIKWEEPSITLKGPEYLQENSLMKKAANLAKGVGEVIPHKA